ncbi:protein yellow-like [Tribolium madens]|uniref:protein yellow-like n=1 Tax=Tribolium madens TaxID=41895 RepID=UPI001CF736EF|nr:protein yellow-like [Tribolium madens]
MNTLTFLLFTFFTSIHTQTSKFYVIRQWKYLNFTWPDEDTLKTATATGDYIPENTIVSGIKYFEDYYYLTLPRMKKGVPATLARIKAGPTQDTAPPLEPFPSWEMNRIGGDCNNLQNVQNVEIDTKGQVWIIDGGRVQTLMEPIVKCGPKLVVFGLREGRVTTVFNFPEEVAARNGSFLYDIVVDDTDGGFAYITDNSATDPGIIVFSVKENRSWKIRSQTMSADRSATLFSVNGVPISAPINIAGIALGPKIHTNDDKLVVNEDREVYFSPLSSLHLYSINTSSLRNSSNTSIKDLGLKSSQSVGMVMDNQGILYYTLLGNNAVGRWDSRTPFQSGQKLIAQDSKHLEWPNSLTLDTSGNLTVLMNRLNRFIYDEFDLSEYNFRLITAFVGGKNYLYDDNFNYDLNRGERMFHNESRMTPEPLPSPEPEPQADYHDHNHENDHDHDHMTSTTMSNHVKIVKSSSHKLASSLFTLILCFLVVRR